MKFISVIGVTIFFLMILMISGASFTDNLQEGLFYKDQVYKQLLKISETKSERINDFLNKRKIDALFLSTEEDVQKIFNKKLNRDVNFISSKIKHIAEDTAKDVEKYILTHPNMTLKDLQESEEFNKIAMKPVGKTGYTVLSDYKNQVIVLHPVKKFIGLTNETWVDKYPAIYRLFNGTRDGFPSYGFYDWMDSDGVVRKKYTYFAILNVRTADNVSLTLNANTYLDEFGETIKLAKNLDMEMRFFRESRGYEDLFFIDIEGNVIWSDGRHDELGTNILTGFYNESLLANIFKKTRNSKKISVLDSGYYITNNKLDLFVSAPVFNDSNKLVGIVALQLNNSKIIELVKTNILSEKKGEVYIVNKDFQHITPLGFDLHKYKTQTHKHIIHSKGIDDCFKNYDNYYFALDGRDFKKRNKFGSYSDYSGSGVRVLGAYSYILNPKWCVISEINEELFLENIKFIDENVVLISVIILIIVFFILIKLDSLFIIIKSGENL